MRFKLHVFGKMVNGTVTGIWRLITLDEHLVYTSGWRDSHTTRVVN